MKRIDKDSPEYATYRKGYLSGYKSGYRKGRGTSKELSVRPKSIVKAHWILRGLDWYCSSCNTEYDQAHTDFCCKCGAQMSEEAEYENH